MSTQREQFQDAPSLRPADIGARSLEPRGARVMVRAVKPPEKIGLLFVPATAVASENDSVGVVVDVGNGRFDHVWCDGVRQWMRRQIDVSVGDCVLFNPDALDMRKGGRFEVENHTQGGESRDRLLMLKEDDIFAVIVGDVPVKTMVGRILIRRDKPPEMIGSIITAPDSKRQTSYKQGRGTVIAVGQSPFQTKVDVGDIVLFDPGAGLVRQWRGEELVCVDERQVDAVVDVS